MLASRIAALTIVTGALAAAASPAFADGSTNPPPVTPGSNVWITDGYTDSFCPTSDSSAIATSDGFKNAITLTRGGGFHGLAGKGWAVDTPGSYGVSITCAGGKSSGAGFQTLVVSPKGAAHTGDGASLLGGTADTVGVVLLGGALGVGVLASRRKAKAAG
jgi:hypothetical protein